MWYELIRHVIYPDPRRHFFFQVKYFIFGALFQSKRFHWWIGNLTFIVFYPINIHSTHPGRSSVAIRPTLKQNVYPSRSSSKGAHRSEYLRTMIAILTCHGFPENIARTRNWIPRDRNTATDQYCQIANYREAAGIAPVRTHIERN